MMSLNTIREMNLERAAEAREEMQEPVELTEHDLMALRDTGGLNGKQFPHLGNYEPIGFERVNILEHPDFADKPTNGFGGTGDDLDDSHGCFFVDSSGFGSPGEPALTLEQFSRSAVPGYFYALTSAGQFQVSIGVFKQI